MLDRELERLRAQFRAALRCRRASTRIDRSLRRFCDLGVHAGLVSRVLRNRRLTAGLRYFWVGSWVIPSARLMGELFVGDHLAELGDVLLDFGDFGGPGASGVVRVGEAGGVFAFGFGEIFERVVESLL